MFNILDVYNVNNKNKFITKEEGICVREMGRKASEPAEDRETKKLIRWRRGQWKH